MRIKQLNRKSIVLAGAVVASVVAFPSTAQAAGQEATATSAAPPPGIACSLDGWVHACFDPAGDVIWVKDTQADGYHADVQMWWGSTAHTDDMTCHSRAGAAGGWAVCTGFAGTIPEDESITLWPMEGDASENIVPSSGGTMINSSTS